MRMKKNIFRCFTNFVHKRNKNQNEICCLFPFFIHVFFLFQLLEIQDEQEKYILVLIKKKFVLMCRFF